MSPEISQVKADLRARLRAARVGRDPYDSGFAHQLLPLIDSATVIAGYFGYGNEPVITRALTHALETGKEVLLPLLRSDLDLEWGSWSGEELVTRGNLQEPETGSRDAIQRADLLILPALAVDQRGIRLGQGGGSYDRVLARVECLTVAVVYDDEIVDSLPHDDYDQAVKMVVTPTRTLRF